MMKKGFTLLELIIVIVILGILATLGYTQYTKQVESTRLAEAKVKIGSMRQLAIEYYFKNGTLTTVQNSDVDAVLSCTANGFFAYWLGSITPTYIQLVADRCTSGGKVPNASRRYRLYLNFWYTQGTSDWRCYYTDDTSSCFGYPP